MSDKPLPFLIGTTAAMIFMVALAVAMVVGTIVLIRVLLCH